MVADLDVPQLSLSLAPVQQATKAPTASRGGRKRTDAAAAVTADAGASSVDAPPQPKPRAAPRSTKNVYAFGSAQTRSESSAATSTNESLILKLRVRADVPTAAPGDSNDGELEGYAGDGHGGDMFGGGAAGAPLANAYTPFDADGDGCSAFAPFDSTPGACGAALGADALAPHAQPLPGPASITPVQQATTPPQGTLRVSDLLKDFSEKTKGGEWPLSTSTCCWWCCHRFDTQPFGLPAKYVGGVFYATGCFCSLECAAAHNLSARDSVDEVFERQSLLNLLGRRLGLGNRVRPAPPRTALQIFGGHMTIEEFRAVARPSSGRVAVLNFPPMATMRQQIEEVNESDVASDLRYVPLDTDRINKYKERLRMQRKRPTQPSQNTLDAVMQFTLGAGGGAQPSAH